MKAKEGIYTRRIYPRKPRADVLNRPNLKHRRCKPENDPLIRQFLLDGPMSSLSNLRTMAAGVQGP